MKGKLAAISIGLLFFASVIVSAQTRELSVSAGGIFSPDINSSTVCIFGPFPSCPATNGLPVGSKVAFGAALAGRLRDFKAVSLYAEVPLYGAPSRTLNGAGSGADFSSVYFGPSLGIKVLPHHTISPFASFGVALAHFGGFQTHYTGALQFGGGVDFKTRLPLLSLRTEIRDYYSGLPGTVVGSGHLNAIFAGGGVVFHF